MRIEEPADGTLVARGTPEEWARAAEGLGALASELHGAVLPAAAASASGQAVVSLGLALALMAALDDDELTHSALRALMRAGVTVRRRRPGRPG